MRKKEVGIIKGTGGEGHEKLTLATKLYSKKLRIKKSVY